MSEMIYKSVGATQKLYEAQGHCFAFDATVLSCEADGDGYAVVLDRTAFFPEGGGQYADTGVLGGAQVRDVQIVDGRILHYTNEPLTVGALVHGELNAQTRYTRMQHHTGEHIISGLIHTAYGYDNVGFHLSDEEMTMDVSGPLTAEQLRGIEREANRIVRECHAVSATYPDEATLASLS